MICGVKEDVEVLSQTLSKLCDRGNDGAQAPYIRHGLRIVCTFSRAMLTVFALAANVAAEPPSPPLDDALVQGTVERLAAIVTQEYFDPDVGLRVSDSLKEGLARGRYSEAATLQSFADRLTRDMFAATSDKHLAVAVRVDETQGAVPRAHSDSSRQARGQRENYGVQRVEILDGNVGYLNLTAFYRPEEARDTLAAVMRTLHHADALILDLRTNAGGSPDTAAILASYFFETPGLPLFEIVDRSGAHRKYLTESTPLSERNESRPLYALTSASTFSAGEGISFVLQERRRAEIVGEQTAGAANPGRPYPINSRFEVTVPNGTVVTAVTGSNWEGSGVIPDVAVSAADALRTAHRRALSKLLSQTTPGTWRDTLQGYLRAMDAKPLGQTNE